MESNYTIDEVFFKCVRLLKHTMIFKNVVAKLTMQQISTLFFLHTNEEVQMKDIAEYFQIEMPTATSLLSKLVALKLVRRHNKKGDRRAVCVMLTSKGEEVVVQAIKDRSEKFSKMLAVLSSEDRKNFHLILQKIVTGLEQRYEK